MGVRGSNPGHRNSNGQTSAILGISGDGSSSSMNRFEVAIIDHQFTEAVLRTGVVLEDLDRPWIGTEVQTEMVAVAFPAELVGDACLSNLYASGDDEGLLIGFGSPFQQGLHHLPLHVTSSSFISNYFCHWQK